MGMKADEIERLIRDAIPGAEIELIDLAGDDDHYSIVVTSEHFRGLSRVQQHKKVFDALQGGMGSRLHALSVKTLIPNT